MQNWSRPNELLRGAAVVSTSEFGRSRCFLPLPPTRARQHMGGDAGPPAKGFFQKRREASSATRKKDRGRLLGDKDAHAEDESDDEDEVPGKKSEWKPKEGDGFRIKMRLPFKAKDVFRELCDADEALGTSKTELRTEMIRPGVDLEKPFSPGYIKRSDYRSRFYGHTLHELTEVVDERYHKKLQWKILTGTTPILLTGRAKAATCDMDVDATLSGSVLTLTYRYDDLKVRSPWGCCGGFAHFMLRRWVRRVNATPDHMQFRDAMISRGYTDFDEKAATMLQCLFKGFAIRATQKLKAQGEDFYREGVDVGDLMRESFKRVDGHGGKGSNGEKKGLPRTKSGRRIDKTSVFAVDSRTNISPESVMNRPRNAAASANARYDAMADSDNELFRISRQSDFDTSGPRRPPKSGGGNGAQSSSSAATSKAWSLHKDRHLKESLSFEKDDGSATSDSFKKRSAVGYMRVLSAAASSFKGSSGGGGGDGSMKKGSASPQDQHHSNGGSMRKSPQQQPGAAASASQVKDSSMKKSSRSPSPTKDTSPDGRSKERRPSVRFNAEDRPPTRAPATADAPQAPPLTRPSRPTRPTPTASGEDDAGISKLRILDD